MMLPKVHIFPDTLQLANYLGTVWKQLLSKTEGEFYFSAPMSRTPLPLYNWVLAHADSFPRWENFRFVYMDEQVEGNDYVPVDDAASLDGFLRRNFLNPLSQKTGLAPETHILRPDLKEIEQFDAVLEKHDGIDLLVLAIGEEGHYAMCMPETPLDTGYHLSDLSTAFVRQHVEKGGPYEGSNFRATGMSLGPKQVREAKQVVFMITGENKHELAKRLLTYTAFDPAFPASIIYHPDVASKSEILLTEDVGIKK